MIRILIDIGATKAQWCCYHELRRWDFVTLGINFAHVEPETVHSFLKQGMRNLYEQSEEFQRGGVFADEIHAFGAGLVSVDASAILQEQLQTMMPMARVECASDLMAAARAACGKKPGIAAIIGTGANTCQWDGKRMVRHIDCGGFILGDEGSAAVLGRLFLTDYLKGLVPKELAGEFSARCPADYSSIVRQVYKSTSPARFLGSIAPFLLNRYEQSSYVKELMDNNFRGLFERTLTRYDAGLPVGVVGGFGHACKSILQRLGAEYGVHFSEFLPSPMDGLVKYYGV